jgi:REP element-mobilizing transposase RayT
MAGADLTPKRTLEVGTMAADRHRINPIVRTPRKRIRLPAGSYREPGSAWLVTMGCEGRVRAFEDAAFAAAFAGLLVERCAALRIGLDLYCLMPNHAHVIIQVNDPATGVVDLFQDIKGRSTRLWWAHGGSGSLWQRSFHDRGLRDAAAYEDAVR